MPEKPDRKSRSRLRTALVASVAVGAAAAALTLLLGRLDFFQLTELITLDLRYRERTPPYFREDLGYINFDEESTALFGPYRPWPRNRQVALVSVLDRYDARAAGYDVFFTEPENMVFLPEAVSEAISEASETVDDASGRSRLEAEIGQAFRSYDHQFAEAMRAGGNIFLAHIMQQPNSDSVVKGGIASLLAETRRIAERFPPSKVQSIEIAKRYAFPSSPDLEGKPGEWGLWKNVDIIPVIPMLGEATAGLGYAQIIKDLDARVRLYPLFMYYDAMVFPSIDAVMLASILEVPFERWKIRLGETVEIPDARIPAADGGEARTGTIRIPVDQYGQMLVNWGGPFREHGLHVSYRDIAWFYAHMLAKSTAMAHSDDPAGIPEIRRSIENLLVRENWVTANEAADIAAKIAVARAAEGLLTGGLAASEAAARLIRNEPGMEAAGITEIVAAVAFAHGISADFPDSLDESWRKEIERNLEFHRRSGGLESARPLFFSPPIRVLWGGAQRDFSPVDLEAKTFIISLTGVGTHDINPQPYEKACPMLALHLNALNTVLTEQTMDFPSPPRKILLVIVLAILAAFIAGATGPLRGFFGCLALGTLFTLFVWRAWVVDRQWVYWFEPTFAIGAAWLGTVLVEFIKAARERQKVRGIFATMVSPKVLKVMEDDPGKFSLSGERKQATIFFSMIGGFSNVTAGTAPDELSSILSLYLTPCTEIIFDFDGIIDKYEGHVIMADFGVPIDDPDHPWKCAYAAIAQQLDIEAFKLFVAARYGEDVTVYQGFNSGYVSAGNMGSEQKMQYTVMGDAVNVAARFMPANLIYNTGTITGEDTEPLVRDYVELRELDKLLLKGKTKPTMIYEVMGWKRESYLETRKGKPLPASLEACWAKCPPEKIIAYAKLYRRKEEQHGNRLAGEIASFFESQQGRAEQIMKHSAVIFVRTLSQNVARMTEIRRRLAPDSPSASDTTVGDELMWRRSLSELRGAVMSCKTTFEELRAAGAATPPELPSLAELSLQAENLVFKIDKLAVSLAKSSRIAWKSIDETLSVIRASLAGELDEPDPDQALQTNINAYRVEVYAFIARLKRDIPRFHEMMAVIGSITEAAGRVRSHYTEALHLHWERRWDEARNALEKALAIDPEDQPSRTLFERIETYKGTPPPPGWQGEFVQTKK